MKGVLFSNFRCYWKCLILVVWTDVAIFVHRYSVHNTQYTLTIRKEITSWVDPNFRKWIFLILTVDGTRRRHIHNRTHTLHFTLYLPRSFSLSLSFPYRRQTIFFTLFHQFCLFPSPKTLTIRQYTERQQTQRYAVKKKQTHSQSSSKHFPSYYEESHDLSYFFFCQHNDLHILCRLQYISFFFSHSYVWDRMPKIYSYLFPS